MTQLISVVMILTLLLGGCAMSTTSTSDVNRDPTRAQERPPESGGGSY